LSFHDASTQVRNQSSSVAMGVKDQKKEFCEALEPTKRSEQYLHSMTEDPTLWIFDGPMYGHRTLTFSETLSTALWHIVRMAAKTIGQVNDNTVVMFAIDNYDPTKVKNTAKASTLQKRAEGKIPYVLPHQLADLEFTDQQRSGILGNTDAKWQFYERVKFFILFGDHQLADTWHGAFVDEDDEFLVRRKCRRPQMLITPNEMGPRWMNYRSIFLLDNYPEDLDVPKSLRIKVFHVVRGGLITVEEDDSLLQIQIERESDEPIDPIFFQIPLSLASQGMNEIVFSDILEEEKQVLVVTITQVEVLEPYEVDMSDSAAPLQWIPKARVFIESSIYEMQRFAPAPLNRLAIEADFLCINASCLRAKQEKTHVFVYQDSDWFNFLLLLQKSYIYNGIPTRILVVMPSNTGKKPEIFDLFYICTVRLDLLANAYTSQWTACYNGNDDCEGLKGIGKKKALPVVLQYAQTPMVIVDPEQPWRLVIKPSLVKRFVRDLHNENKKAYPFTAAEEQQFVNQFLYMFRVLQEMMNPLSPCFYHSYVFKECDLCRRFKPRFGQCSETLTNDILLEFDQEVLENCKEEARRLCNERMHEIEALYAEIDDDEDSGSEYRSVSASPNIDNTDIDWTSIGVISDHTIPPEYLT
jgi:(2Fe-2S) ferredoxin